MTIDVSAPTADCRARHDAKDARACRRRDNNDAVVALGLPWQSADAIELSRQARETVYDESIAFGHVVSVYFKDAFEKHAATFAELGVNPNNGLGAVFGKIKGAPEAG